MGYISMYCTLQPSGMLNGGTSYGILQRIGLTEEETPTCFVGHQAEAVPKGRRLQKDLDAVPMVINGQTGNCQQVGLRNGHH